MEEEQEKNVKRGSLPSVHIQEINLCLPTKKNLPNKMNLLSVFQKSTMILKKIVV